MAADISSDFDLQPDPRILPMLGEINLAQWKCLAELIDNSIDAFLDIARAGTPASHPEIVVSIPSLDAPTAKVTIQDNGPGMAADKLERAVRAGWSGSDPMSNLGLFGMGFNIATARLGTVTTVWTTRAGDAEWIGLRIDFDAMRNQRHFRTPRLSRPKNDPTHHGTEVTIENLKIEQRQWFAKPANRSNLKRELSRAYSAMLRSGGIPISFRLHLNNQAITGRQHCIWGADGSVPRNVESNRYGTVGAYQTINVELPERPFCRRCWQWLPPGEGICATCQTSGDVVSRRRVIRGWLGLQRYLSKTEFGIDFLRHGRKIEIANRDLFFWQDGDALEPEYPIDDPRQRGRIVGEIHLDHCRVTYTKDRFDRNDPAWDEMVRLIRGEGPLRPDKASELGFGPNDTPLFKLFQVFRRSSPKPRVAGCYAKLLIVPDNDRAEEMGRRFHDGDAHYQSDGKWWELVEEADRQLLVGGGGGASPSAAPSPGPTDTLDGFGPPHTALPGSPSSSDPPSQLPAETPVASLSGQFRSDSTSMRWNVHAYEVEESHPSLAGTAKPWHLTKQSDGIDKFVVNVRHPVFASATMTPLDALLAELSWSMMDFQRGSQGTATFASALTELRLRYAGVHALDPVTLATESRQVLASIAGTLAQTISAQDAITLFADLPRADQEAILQRMASRSTGNPQTVIGQGRFLEYAPPHVVRDFVASHPELFFDGKCWDDAYGTLDYGVASATQEAQARVLKHYEALIADAVWIADQETADLSDMERARLLRAQLAIDLLSPTATEATTS
jgi:Histidine kinase-, DNA gyrase B-, and HSP90-like ATPase